MSQKAAKLCYEIIYDKGLENMMADALSCICKTAILITISMLLTLILKTFEENGARYSNSKSSSATAI